MFKKKSAKTKGNETDFLYANRRSEILMFICNFINKDATKLDFLKDCNNDELKAVQEYIEALRLQLLDELGD